MEHSEGKELSINERLALLEEAVQMQAEEIAELQEVLGITPGQPAQDDMGEGTVLHLHGATLERIEQLLMAEEKKQV